MKKHSWKKVSMAVVLSLVLVLSFNTLALAATLDNWSGQSCGEFVGTWHFVNNQTGGAGPGQLTATIGGVTQTVAPSAVNKNTQHFIVISAGALEDAFTNLPGKLVLSDFSCDVKEPPKDPKDPK